MSWHTPHPAIEPPLTVESLIDSWRADDELVSTGSPLPTRAPGFLIVARFGTGLLVSSVAVFIGPVLRAVGGA